MLAATLASATPNALEAQAPPQKVARATRIVGAAPHIDGALDDAAWQRAEIIPDFVQKIPDRGRDARASRTEVRMLYDDDALYVGARLHAQRSAGDPHARSRDATARATPRCSPSRSITYLDRRTAYSFSVSSGGVRGDAYHSQDSEDSGREPQFDPVWSARARVDARGLDGRAAHSVLAAALQRGGPSSCGGCSSRATWPTRRERVQWVLIPVAAAGFSSRFGRLEGIAGIPPTRRIELLPYVATDLTFRVERGSARTRSTTALGARAGGDLKLGLGPNLTLDATINPGLRPGRGRSGRREPHRLRARCSRSGARSSSRGTSCSPVAGRASSGARRGSTAGASARRRAARRRATSSTRRPTRPSLTAAKVTGRLASRVVGRCAGRGHAAGVCAHVRPRRAARRAQSPSSRRARSA